MQRVVSGLLLLAAGCSFDTALPEQPQRGRIFGILDTSDGGQRPEGWPIALSSDKGDEVSATTSDGGLFLFSDLAPGLYLATARPAGYESITSSFLRVRSGVDTDAGVLMPQALQQATPPEQFGTLEAKVVGQMGANITGAKVEFVQGTLVVDSTLVAADGLVSRRLPPGGYTLKVAHPYFISPMPVDITLSSGGVTDITAMPLQLDINPATLTGAVTQESVTDGGSPAKGATVTLDTGETTSVDVAGTFSITGLAAGPRQVRVTLPSFHDPITLHTVALMPGASTALDPVTLLPDLGAIRGQVQTGDGAPVSGARAEVSGLPLAALVSPDPNNPTLGTFLIENVPLGTWGVSAGKDQYSRSNATAVISRQGEIADVGLLKLSRLQGDFLITDADPNNTPGYTRTLGVTLDFTGFPSTGVVSYRASEDPAFDGGTFQNYTGPQQPFTLSQGDGPHTVYAQYTDNMGQRSQPFSATVVLDTVPPATPQVTFQATGTAGATKYSNVAANIPLQVISNDGTGSGLSKMMVGSALDGMGNVTAASGAYAVTTLYPSSAAPTGPLQVFVQVVDNAGNTSTVGTDTVTIDTTPPSGTLAIAQGAKATDPGYTNSPLVSVAETWSDGPNNVVLIKLANTSAGLDSAVYQPVTASATWLIDASADGLKSVYLRFRDAAGNESPANMAPATITYDTHAPNPAMISLVTPAVAKSPSVTVQLNTNVSDLSSTQAVTLSDESTFTSATTTTPAPYPVSAQASLTLPAGDGLRTVFARFRDKAGNDAVTSVTLTLDTQPPQGSFTLVGTLADGTASSTLTATNQVTVNLSPGGAVEYRLGDATMTTCPASGYTPITTPTLNNQTLPAGGVVTLCLRDAAGNAEGPLSQMLTYDNVGPTGCTVSLLGLRADGTTAAPSGQSAKAVITATVSGCSAGTVDFYLVNGTAACSPTLSASWQGYGAPSAVPFLLANEGSNTVSGCVRDAARNVTAIPSAAMTLDTTPPAALGITINNGAAYFNLSQQTGGMNVVSVLGQATGATEWALSEGTPSSFGAFSGAASNFTLPGNGVHTIHAVFRDALGNPSSAVSASITVDTTGPAAAPAPTVTPAGFTPSASVVVHVNPPADADALQLAQAAGGACAASDFNGAAVRGLVGDYPFVLAGGDAPKLLCARTQDLAGNTSPIGSVGVTLDTTPPTTPRVTTANTVYLGIDGGSSFTVNLVGPVTDTNFSAYQTRNMAVTPSWATASTNINTTAFAFALVTDGGVTGTLNQLRVRAVDQAGNASEESFVNVVLDQSAPPPVTTSVDWVDNGDRRATAFWQPSTAPDVVGYRVYYDSVVQSPLQGTYANEGPSPVTVGLQSSITLSGLTNEAQTVVRVAAVDLAGNEGAPAPVAQPYLTLRPNQISPNGVPPLALTGQQRIERIVVDGDLAYVIGLGPCSSGFSGTRSAVLNVVDLSKMATPIQTGAVVASPGAPAQLYTYNFAELMTCPVTTEATTDAIVDGPWLYVAEADRVVIFDRSVPGTLTVKATVPFAGWTVSSIALVGPRLVISAKTNVAVLMLDKLFDNDSTTFPTAADVTGTATNGFLYGAGITVTRDRAVQVGQQGTTYVWSLVDALDAPAAGTVWDNSDLQVSSLSLGSVNARMPAAGNLLFSGSWAQGYNVYDVSALWSGGLTIPLAASSAYNVQSFQSDISGALAFLPVNNGGRIIDFSQLSAPQSRAAFGTGAQVATVAAGLYTLGGAFGVNTLYCYELATPRGPHVVQTGIGTGFRPTVAGGLIYTESGVVLDGTSGSSLTVLRTGASSSTEGCTPQSAFFGDTEVMAVGGAYRVVDLEKETDRNVATATTFSQHYDIALPAGSRATGAAAWGNYLVTAEVRTTGTSGVYVRVFKANALRDEQASTTFALSDLVGEQLVAPYSAASVIARITMSRGRAVVAIESGAQGNNVVIVDLRHLFDDNAGTVVDATYVQATLDAGTAIDAKVQGNWLYAATANGLEVVNVTEAFDEDNATVVPGSAPRVTLSPFVGFGTQYTSVDVSGSYVSAVRGNAFDFFDVSAPLTQRIVSSTALQSTVSGCTYPVGGGSFLKWPSVTLAGGRAYVNSSTDLFVYELE
jgi:hypothetical protein